MLCVEKGRILIISIMGFQLSNFLKQRSVPLCLTHGLITQRQTIMKPGD